MPEEVLRLREQRPDYKQPEYPGITVDPTTCAKEIAWIRAMVRQHPDKKYPAGPVRITQNSAQGIVLVAG